MQWTLPGGRWRLAMAFPRQILAKSPNGGISPCSDSWLMAGGVPLSGREITCCNAKTLAKSPNALWLLQHHWRFQALAKSPKPLKFKPFLRFL
jgi:hypothetical protein